MRVQAIGSRAAVLASVGLTVAFVPTAGALPARVAPGGRVGEVSSARLVLSAAGRAERAASTSTSALGAVRFLNLYQVQAGVHSLDIMVTQGSTTVGTITDLASGAYTVPELLPAGAYQVTATGVGDGQATATTSMTVQAGKDESVGIVEYPTVGHPYVTVEADPVTSTPVGADTVVFRNDSVAAGPVDVYVNGSRVATAVAELHQVAVTVAPGTFQVRVYKTGTMTAPEVSTALTGTADSYAAFTLIDLNAEASGVGYVLPASSLGYQFTAADGGVFNFGSFPFLGSEGGLVLNKPVVGGAESPDGVGYWQVASDGGVFAHGVPFLGSLGATKLDAPIVGMASVVGPDGRPGYILAAADGGVFTFNAAFYGSLGGHSLSSPVVGVAADAQTGSYVLAEADGSVTAFGPGLAPVTTPAAATLNAPIVGIAETPDGGGAWLVAADGGVFTAGDASFLGSEGAVKLNQPVVGIAPTYDGLGYSLIARDGGVFTFGNAGFYGSTGAVRLTQPVVGAIG